MTTGTPDLAFAARRAVERCLELARFSDEEGRLTRTFLSPATRDVHARLHEWMTAADLEVTVDAVGNVLGHRGDPGKGTLLIGSHVDTVPNAGAFDGLLGVTLALELAEALRSEPLPFRLAVVAFSEEEGVRFGVPFLGSRAVAGTLDFAWLDDLRDAHGRSPRDALEAFGLDASNVPNASLRGRLLGFLEVHIEQGPVLQDLGAPIGLVSAINGQTRADVHFRGRAAHAGTTPMHLRHDALTAASALVLACERLGRDTSGLTATVGRLHVEPGVANVIPGGATLTLDVRHTNDDTRRAALATLEGEARRAASERGVDVTFHVTHDQNAVPMNDPWRARLARVAGTLNFPLPDLPSGAGHDAMILAEVAPAAMIFVRSPNGISHHPDEIVNVPDVEAALRLALAFVRDLARHPA